MIPAKTSTAGVPTLLALWLLASPLPAEDLERLRDEFETAAESLEAAIDTYFDARERENDAMTELARLSRQLDDTLGNPHGSRSDLMNLETRVAVARELAFGLSEESAAQRRSMYDGMKRLAEMARRLERLGIGPAGDGINGSWHVEATPNEVFGVMNLRQQGSLVIGDYRLSNGAAGSVKGTFAGSRLELELIDSERGNVGTIEGELDESSGEVRGVWQARELAGGRPTAGDWTARRLTLEAGEGR